MVKTHSSAKFKRLNAERLALINKMFSDEGLTPEEQRRYEELKAYVEKENAKAYRPIIERLEKG